MFLTLWTLKGGAGCSVVAAALARARARVDPDGAILVDLCGDQPHLFGCPNDGPGVGAWLAESGSVPDALGRLGVEVCSGLSLVGRGPGPLPELTDDALGPAMAQAGAHPATVVVDAGSVVGTSARARLAQAFAREGGSSILVTRACYLALRRVNDIAFRPSGVVLVREPGRALGPDDVEAAVGAPVVAEIAIDPAVARAVDAGLLSCRLPRAVDRSLGGLCR